MEEREMASATLIGINTDYAFVRIRQAMETELPANIKRNLILALGYFCEDFYVGTEAKALLWSLRESPDPVIRAAVMESLGIAAKRLQDRGWGR